VKKKNPNYTSDGLLIVDDVPKRKQKPKASYSIFLTMGFVVFIVAAGAMFAVIRSSPVLPSRTLSNITIPVSQRIIVTADELPLYTEPNSESSIIETVIEDSVRTILNGIRDDQGIVWWYVKDGYGWLPEMIGDERTLELYSRDILENTLTETTSRLQDTPDAQLYFQRGWTFYGLENYSAAIEDLTNAIELDRQNSSFYAYRGKVYLDDRQYQLALDDFEQAIALGEQGVMAYLRRGLASVRLRQYDEALDYYQRALELNPAYGLLYNNIGVVYDRMGDKETALDYYMRAIEIDPDYPGAYTNIAIIRMASGDIGDGTLSYYNRALEIDPSDANAFFNRGILYFHRGDYTRALENHSQAIALDPTYALAYSERGNCYIQLHDYEQALRDLLYSVELDSTNGFTFYFLGLTYHHLNEYQTAIYMYDKALELNPEIIQARNNRDQLYNALGEPDLPPMQWQAVLTQAAP
jgi:tetratricopeptide (TPR) repeat protein